MSEMGDDFRAMKNDRQRGRWDSHYSNMKMLDESGENYDRLSDIHIRVGKYDFWTTSGLFIDRSTKKRGYGLKELLKILDKEGEK